MTKNTNGLALALVLGLAVGLGGSNAGAQSDAEMPTGWENWPVVKEGAIPDNQTAIPADLPPIVQETVKTYNWVNDGKGTAYLVRIHPDKLEAYQSGATEFADGPTAILDLTDIGVLFITEHLVNEPLYGTYSYKGDDLTGAHPSLGTQTCVACHSGYTDVCVAGVCAR